MRASAAGVDMVHPRYGVEAHVDPGRAYVVPLVNPALQSAIEAMSLDERLALVEYIDSTVPVEVTEEQRAAIRSRASELEADPSIGLTWGELKARLAARRA